ncbi:energy transducer TonB family protein [Parasulfitobacter algicola]|uniref:Energy transducer TonB n=1 Tax=Parasulfitobacter algicola TaxID=2614809 RepID=A0ABX2ITG6_9RHOB|nr:energy transducer TonB [Sulfitobacter algicola]NSX56204.1 energy transducer TonB [Sulfitobacter algicola]
MIASSRKMQIAALASAFVLHLGFGIGMAPETMVQVESTQGALEARIGTSFADMAAGTLTSHVANQITERVQPDEVAEIIPPTSLPDIKTNTIEVLKPTPSETPLLNTTEILPADTLPNTSPVASMRPKNRPENIATRNTQTTVQPTPPAPGNAKQNNTQGSSTGARQSRAKVQGTAAGTSRRSGNAEISNYPGRVMSQISRVPKPRVRSSGSAVISFSISSNGGLARVSLTRSSGFGELDRAAIDVIRKAAPFPIPPNGAQKSFSITITGR